jgi:flagellar protein FlaG
VQVRAHRDDASARLVLQVRDRTTGEVIEQYPPEQLLRFYAALRESLGALVDQCA